MKRSEPDRNRFANVGEKMDSQQKAQEEPLDAARVVPYRQWSDPAVDNDQRLGFSGGNSSASLWTAGLMAAQPAAPVAAGQTEKGGSWLAGLIKEEPETEASTATAHKLAGWVREDAGRGRARWALGQGLGLPLDSNRRSWASGLTSEEPEVEPTAPAPSTSWLAGLVQEEKRPPLPDIARLLLGDSVQAPTPPLRAENLIQVSPPAPTLDQPAADTFLEPPAANLQPFPEAPEANPDPFPSAPTAAAPPTVPRPSPAIRVEPVKPRLELDSALRSSPRLPKAAPEPSPATPPERDPDPPLITAAKPKPAKAKPQGRPMARSVASRDKVSFYRSLATMFEAGVPVFAIFEFLSREGESAAISQACRRMGQALVSGMPLPAAAFQEPGLFDAKAVRMLDVGYRGGQLGQILVQLAEDEEHAWTMKQTLRSQLTYPCGIALLTLVAVVVLPPLVLTDLLKQVVALTAKPPFLTQVLLNASAFISSPWTLITLAALVGAVIFFLRTPRGQNLIDNMEMTLWFLPVISSLWRNVVSLRFLRVFAMTYGAGLPATLGMELAASSTGSQLAYRVYPLMKRTLTDGGTLAESFAAGGFLPVLALESIAAGEMVGKVPVMLENTSQVLTAEVQSRVEAVAKLIEPIVLACLGAFVGVFVLGCLLPIVELTSTL